MDVPASDTEQTFYDSPGSVGEIIPTDDLTEIVGSAAFGSSPDPDSALLQLQINQLQKQHEQLVRRTEDDATERTRLHDIIDASKATNVCGTESEQRPSETSTEI
jgi:hypothetical protein